MSTPNTATPTEGETQSATAGPRTTGLPRPSRLGKGLSVLMTGAPESPTPDRSNLPVAPAEPTNPGLATLTESSNNDEQADDLFSADEPFNDMLNVSTDESVEQSTLESDVTGGQPTAQDEVVNEDDAWGELAAATAASLHGADEVDVDDEPAESIEQVESRTASEAIAEAMATVRDDPEAEAAVVRQLTRAVEVPIRSAHLQLARATMRSRVTVAAAAVCVGVLLGMTAWATHAVTAARGDLNNMKQAFSAEQQRADILGSRLAQERLKAEELAGERDSLTLELAANERALNAANEAISTLERRASLR